MSPLTLAEIIAGILGGRDQIDRVLAGLEAISPAVLQGPEEALRQAVAGVLAGVDLSTAETALAGVQQVLASGRGPTAGGADATLA